MTVLATTASSGPYAPNGSTRAFPFSFVTLSTGELYVTRRSASGIDTIVVGGYSVSLNSDQSASPGGTVTFSAAPTAGDPIYIISNPNFQQQTSFANQGSWSPTATNLVNDRAAVRDISLKDKITNALALALSARTDMTAFLAGSSPTNATLNAASRTLLAALNHSLGIPAYLTEAGREGLFVWDGGNNAPNVTADPLQAFYVPPQSDATGVSGSWVRRYNGPVAATWFGAKGDGVTDDATALQTWFDFGGWINSGGRVYRSSAKLFVRRTVNLFGSGYGFDEYRQTAGTLTPSTKIVFDPGVGGFDIQPQVSATTFPAGAATQEGAYNSQIRDLALIGGGGATATGLYCRTLIHLTNVASIGFSGDGFDISASTNTDATAEYGNASLSTMTRCVAQGNGGRGFHLRGVDANVIKLDSCNAFGNTSWGFDDAGLLGDLYVNCHAAGNVGGSYRGIGSVANHTYLGCYVENDLGVQCDLSYRCVVSGGSLAGGALSSNLGTNGIPQIIGAAGAVFTSAQFKTAQNAFGAISGTAYAYRHANDGLVLQGAGGAADLTFKNKNDQAVFAVGTGTRNSTIYGHLADGLTGNLWIGDRAPAIAGAAGAAGGTPTAAEFGALVTKFNTLLSYLSASGAGYHGLLS
jgi:hypothetical protein